MAREDFVNRNIKLIGLLHRTGQPQLVSCTSSIINITYKDCSTSGPTVASFRLHFFYSPSCIFLRLSHKSPRNIAIIPPNLFVKPSVYSRLISHCFMLIANASRSEKLPAKLFQEYRNSARRCRIQPVDFEPLTYHSIPLLDLGKRNIMLFAFCFFLFAFFISFQR
jgi:hypothetical protein